MARPAIDRLFDHTVRIWRPTPERSTLGVEERTYQVVASVGARVNRSTTPVGDVGPGDAPMGTRRMYLKPDADVEARDLIELLTGPDSPGLWEVDEIPTRPQGHHTQLDCIAWNGEQPIEES